MAEAMNPVNSEYYGLTLDYSTRNIHIPGVSSCDVSHYD
jgi:hypothetical protein